MTTIVCVIICTILTSLKTSNDKSTSVVSALSLQSNWCRLTADYPTELQNRLRPIDFSKSMFQIFATVGHVSLTTNESPSRMVNFYESGADFDSNWMNYDRAAMWSSAKASIYELMLRFHYGPNIMMTVTGFMTGLSTLSSMEKSKDGVSFVDFALRRLLRTLPSTLAAVAVYHVYWDHVTYFSDRGFGANDSCHRNLWSTLLMISNHNENLRETVSLNQ